MHPADAKRRERFVAYVKRRFGDAVTRPRSEERRALQTKLKYSKGSMTQIFDARQAFGQRRGSQLAVRLGLDPEHFERDPQAAGAPVAMSGIDGVNGVTKSSKRSIPREWVEVYNLLLPEERKCVLALAQMRLHDRGVNLDHLRYTPEERADRMAEPGLVEAEDELHEVSKEEGLHGAVRGPDHRPRDRKGAGHGESNGRREAGRAKGAKQQGKKKKTV